MGKIIDRLFGLEGKNIVLGGGAGQIGFAMALALADAGAKVAIADIDEEMAREKIRNAGPELAERLSFYKLDVSSKTAVQANMNEIAADMGSIYGLVNCFHFKGNTRKLDTSSNFFAGFEDYPEEAWDLVHDVNLKGSFLMSQAVIPFMKKAGGGNIVNISSTYGNVSANKNIYGNSGINSPVAYGTSKAALINLSRYIATHFADAGIRCNTLSPGGVFNNQSEEFLKNYTALTPLARMAEAEDYQAAIVFLMSPGTAYMTGANLVIDGGWTAW